DAPAAVYSINRLKPELLCFFVPESAKSLVETAVQPQISQMPRRWDWVVTPDAHRFMACYQALSRTLPDLLRTWEVHPGELVVDLTGTTPAMAASLSLASLTSTSRVVALGHVNTIEPADGETVTVEGRERVWVHGNPWDEAAALSRREGCELFNRGAFTPASSLFRQIESRVSGGLTWTISSRPRPPRCCEPSKPFRNGNCSNNTRSRPGMCSRSSCRKRCVSPVGPVIWMMWMGNTSCRFRASSARWLGWAIRWASPF